MTHAPRFVLLLLTLVLFSACRFGGSSGGAAAPAAPPARPAAPPTHRAEVANVALAAGVLLPAPIPSPPAPTPVEPPTAAPLAPTATAWPTVAPDATPPPLTATPQPILVEPTAQPFAPSMDQRPAHIRIEAIGLDRSLVPVGLTPDNVPVVPDYDAAWYTRSATPGGGENVVVWGHALRFVATPNVPAPFERVKEARIGDSITITTVDGTQHRYTIQEQIWATPDQVRYILPQGREQLTLVNCIGEIVIAGGNVDMTHRLITIALPAA